MSAAHAEDGRRTLLGAAEPPGKQRRREERRRNHRHDEREKSLRTDERPAGDHRPQISGDTALVLPPDVQATQPQRVAELRDRLHAWQREVGAQLATPNPKYNPAKPEYTPPPAKAKKAAELGVTTLTEEEWLKLAE